MPPLYFKWTILAPSSNVGDRFLSEHVEEINDEDGNTTFTPDKRKALVVLFIKKNSLSSVSKCLSSQLLNSPANKYSYFDIFFQMIMISG